MQPPEFDAQFSGGDVFASEIVRPPVARLQGGGPGMSAGRVVQPEGAFPVPDAAGVGLDAVDRADVGHEQLMGGRVWLVADDPRAGKVELEIERRCAAEPRLGQGTIPPLEHGEDHALLGLGIVERVFAAAKPDLFCVERHLPGGVGC